MSEVMNFDGRKLMIVADVSFLIAYLHLIT
jgi:hypothetical protein